MEEMILKDEITVKIEKHEDQLRGLNLNETLIIGSLNRLDTEAKYTKIGYPMFDYVTAVRPLMQQELMATRDIKADLLEIIRVITKLRLAIKMEAIGEPLEDSVELIEAKYNMLNSIFEPELVAFQTLQRKCFTLISEAQDNLKLAESEHKSIFTTIGRVLNGIFTKNRKTKN